MYPNGTEVELTKANTSNIPVCSHGVVTGINEFGVISVDWYDGKKSVVVIENGDAIRKVKVEDEIPE
jgi:hypothetical protein